jgi:hypothetical protein
MVCSGVAAGFALAQPTGERSSIIAASLTALSFLMVLVAEYLATRAETELELLVAVIVTNGEVKATSDDTILGLNRLIDMLNSQNHSFRGKLLREKILEQNETRREEGKSNSI